MPSLAKTASLGKNSLTEQPKAMAQTTAFSFGCSNFVTMKGPYIINIDVVDATIL
jgi:hypothetical protein